MKPLEMHRQALLVSVICAVYLLLGMRPAVAQSSFLHHYNRLANMAPDAIILELHELVVVIADRGSAVSSASQRRRVDGFELALLRGLKSSYCFSKQTSQATLPWSGLENIVQSAARSQRLPVDGEDVAEISALAQHWIDRRPRDRWCNLSTMSDVP